MSVWTEKYRPMRLDDIKGHKRIKILFKRGAVNKFKNFPPVILYGPPGTGKTSIALSLAKETYPEISPVMSTLYLNASDERSIEVIRERILQFTQTIWPGVERKFVIFDEIETMTEAAQAALRSLLDDVDRDNHTTTPLFLFLCNSLYRVHPTVRSRCVSLFCGHIPIHQVRETLENIQKIEGVPKIQTPSELTFHIQRGDLRSFVSALQYGGELNPWDSLMERLIETGRIRKSIFAWEEGLSRVPFCILIRHVFIFLELHGFLEKKGADEFISKCLEIQNSPHSILVSVLPDAWEKFINS